MPSWIGVVQAGSRRSVPASSTMQTRQAPTARRGPSDSRASESAFRGRGPLPEWSALRWRSPVRHQFVRKLFSSARRHSFLFHGFSWRSRWLADRNAGSGGTLPALLWDRDLQPLPAANEPWSQQARSAPRGGGSGWALPALCGCTRTPGRAAPSAASPISRSSIFCAACLPQLMALETLDAPVITSPPA